MKHTNIERPWSHRGLDAFLGKYGWGDPREKTPEMQQKLWRLHALSGFRIFGPGYSCFTPFPVMVAQWEDYYTVIGHLRTSLRGNVSRIAANGNSRFATN